MKIKKSPCFFKAIQYNSIICYYCCPFAFLTVQYQISSLSNMRVGGELPIPLFKTSSSLRLFIGAQDAM